MNALKLSESIQKSLAAQANYLRPVQRHFDATHTNETKVLKAEFDKAVEKYPFRKNLYVESIPAYLQSDKITLHSLAEEGIIQKETADAFAQFFHCDAKNFRPYTHQEKALKAVLKNNQNLIVCTGTGSGKTESFLMPIIDTIIQERKNAKENEKEYQKGIRALILYPMNALVNDQVSRIRRLIRGAQKCNIEYAKDITYGIYTGDLDQSEKRKVGDELDLENWNGEFGEAKHDGFTSEEIPSTEYRSRIRWKNEGCADIIITNYVMLEQLLLNPTMSFMFNKDGMCTWKYIVLDEAHMYDGGLGTDISWLIKRVVQRCNPNEPLHYIATTATLLDDDSKDIDQKADTIKEKFASQIFPAKPDTFSVQFGETFRISKGKGSQFTWKGVAREKIKNIIDTLKINLDSVINKLGSETLQGGMSKILTPSLSEDKEIPKNSLDDLVALTHWYKDIVKWLGQWDFLLQDTKDVIANIIDNKQPLGDVIWVAGMICKLDPDYVLPIDMEEFPIIRDLYERSRKRGTRWKVDSVLSDIIAIYQENSYDGKKKRKNNIKEYLRKNQTDVTAEEFIILNQFAREIARLKESDKECLQNVLVPWKNLSIIHSLKCVILELKKLLGCSDKDNSEDLSFKGVINGLWKEVIEASGVECKGKNYTEMITEAIKSNSLFWELYEEFAQNKGPLPYYSNGKLKENSVLARDGFEELAQLLPLSYDLESRRPLLDLRFHLLVSGIAGAAVYFSKTEDESVKANFVFDNDDNYEQEMYHEGAPLFTLGICHGCGQPYILVYEEEENQNERLEYPAYTIRHGDKSKSTKYRAYSWIKGDHEDDDSQGNSDRKGGKKSTASKYWLNYTSGIVYQQDDCPSLEGEYIELFYRTEAETASTFIKDCPACCASRPNRNENEYGIIAPYCTGAVKDRTNILTSLVASADPSINVHGAIAQGRKILAFSDSRAGAASLARDTDSEVEELLVKQIVEDVIEHKNSSVTDFAKFYESDDSRRSFNCSLTNKIKHWRDEINDGDMKECELESKIVRRANKDEFDSSLLGITYPLYKRLETSEATSLIAKEYLDEEANSHEFDDIAGISLLALGALRSNRREGLIKSGRIKVYSHAHRMYLQTPEKNDDRREAWEDYSEDFEGEKATEFLNEVLNILFKESRLYCDDYDKKSGEYYLDETDELVNGYSSGIWSKKLIYRVKIDNVGDNKIDEVRNLCNDYGTTKFQKKLKKDYKITGSRYQSSILSKLVKYMILSNIVIPVEVEKDGYKTVANRIEPFDLKDYNYCYDSYFLLNLDDIRFEIGKERSEELRRKEQYYRVEEHTAQLSTVTGRIHQNLFMDGKINILSCSTTFEMGVDLGELNCVFLSNLPPDVANYRQRAGRAGRRAGSTSLAVTYLGHSGHDLSNREHPERLMFGRVTMPKIYGENVSYRAKHFRAEALSHFLRYVLDGNPDIKWYACRDFFGEGLPDGESHGLIAKIWDWLRDENEVKALQRYCEQLNDNNPICVNGSKYLVAEDFVWQVAEMIKNGDDEYCFKSVFHRDLTQSLELSGPHLPSSGNESDIWNKPVEQKFRNTIEILKDPDKTDRKERDQEENEDAHKRVKAFLDKSVTSYLAQNRVLPRYGFPCDVIELIPHWSDRKHNKEVELERDAKQGLFEYAPGEQVVANKRGYVSSNPISYVRGKDKDGKQKSQRELFVIPINKCENCQTYFPRKEGGTHLCPVCGSSNSVRKIDACMPDAFRAEKSTKARSFSPKKTVRKRVYYPGKLGFSFRSTSNCIVASSDTRVLWYINDNKSKKQKNETENVKLSYDVIMREIRTDMVLISHAQDKDEFRDVQWESALAAILKATADVMEVSSRDIDGFITTIEGKKYILIFDNSSSGSGSLLSLMPCNHVKRDGEIQKNIRDILKRAIKICEGRRHDDDTCDCYDVKPEQKYYMSVSHSEWLQRKDEKVREAKSCYKCLKTYSNQSRHDKLDAYDALRLLKWLMGEDLGEDIETKHETLQKTLNKLGKEKITCTI